jgi:hypothetical protein
MSVSTHLLIVEPLSYPSVFTPGIRADLNWQTFFDCGGLVLSTALLYPLFDRVTGTTALDRLLETVRFGSLYFRSASSSGCI